MSEIVYYKRLKYLGLSEEYFFALPYECQRAIMMAGLDSDKKRKDAFQKIVDMHNHFDALEDSMK